MMTGGCDKLHACDLGQLTPGAEDAEDHGGDHQRDHAQAEKEVGLPGHQGIDPKELGEDQAGRGQVEQGHRRRRDQRTAD